MTKPVILDYKDLINPNTDLNDYIERAFGSCSDCLGLCLVSNVPELLEKRQRLLRTASRLAALPKSQLDKIQSPESCFSFGWSHGKEIMNGKPDFAKGSFYNNPIYNVPPCQNLAEYRKEFPEYGLSNIWPSESLPTLETEFMDLGALIVKVGMLVARHCDKYLKQHFNAPLLHSMIQGSITHKARLLHYFPISETENENFDSWCGLHVDHSVLTGLTAAMYIDESDDSFNQVDKSVPGIASAIKSSGLFIKNRDGSFMQASIPDDHLAFQIGQAAQIASNNLLVATPHLVRGASYPSMARNTFAVFMQPNTDSELKPEYNFAQFTKDIMNRHYNPKV